MLLTREAEVKSSWTVSAEVKEENPGCRTEPGNLACRNPVRPAFLTAKLCLSTKARLLRRVQENKVYIETNSRRKIKVELYKKLIHKKRTRG